MTSRTRLSPGLPMLAALLIALGTLAGCGPNPPEPSSDTLDALSVFPADVQSVSMIDLQRLKEDAGISFFGERGIQITLLDSDVVFDPLSSEQRADLEAFIEASGFNPDTDLQSVYVATSPMGETVEMEAPLLVLNAQFERDRLAASLADATDLVTPVDTEGDIPVFSFADAERNANAARADDRRMALLDNRRIAIGSPADIDALLDRTQSGTGGFEASADDRELIGYASASNAAWSVILTMPEQMDNLGEMLDGDASTWQERIARVASITQQAGLGISLTSEDVDARLTLVANDDASDVSSLLRGLSSGAQSYSDISETQRTFLQDLEINDTGRFVHIDMHTTQR
ncbi:MAG: hypothetical protein R6U20_02690, partial [Longimonas sp.]|uniref:hypothetical protein n=1 Tax=Longimonas sp. TaxID=2039626 RepID=UPI00397641F2